MDDKGEIYFDIPIRKNKRFEISSFGVSRINDEGFAAPPFWVLRDLITRLKENELLQIIFHYRCAMVKILPEQES